MPHIYDLKSLGNNSGAVRTVDPSDYSNKCEYESYIGKNLEKIRKVVNNAAISAGRRPDDITILAASKTRTPDEITQVYECGITVFGENYVQEFLPKYDALLSAKNIEWHVIGRLQKNKVKYIVGKIKLIHSVDSLELAQIIDKISFSKNNPTDILLGINLSNEPTKSGITPFNVEKTIKELNGFDSIRLKGFMTMPPLTEHKEENRKYFKALREILFDVNAKNFYKNELKTLSMGTSQDFEIAIEEGSSIIRLGTTIFGKREKNKI